MEIFQELRKALEQELVRTGFRPPAGPPFDEPEMPRRLKELSVPQLVDLVDDFQCFYNYLSDEITSVLTFEAVTKARADHKHADVKLEVAQNKSLTNETSRSVMIETDERWLTAVRDYLYFKQSHAQLEERRRKISKSIERLYRELIYRDQQANQRSQTYGHHPHRAPMPAPYRGGGERVNAVQPARSKDSVPGKVDDPASVRQQDVHEDPERIGPVQGDEGLFGAGGGGVAEAVAPGLQDAGSESTSPFGSRSLPPGAVQPWLSEKYAQSVQEERRVKPSKGRGGFDGEDPRY